MPARKTKETRRRKASDGREMQALLLAVAFHDRAFSASWLEKIQIDDDEIDALIKRGMLAESGGGFQIGPKADRKAIVDTATWSAKRRTHLLLATLCSQPPPRFEAAGRHFAAAGKSGEAARAYLNAADAHCRRHHHRSAARCFETGMPLLPTDAADEEVIQAIQGLGQCASLSEEYDRAIELLGDWSSAPPWNQKPAVRCEVNLALASLFSKAMRHAESGQARKKAADDLSKLGRAHEAAGAALAAAGTLAYALQLANAQEAAEDAIEAAKRTNNPELQAQAATLHGFVLGVLGKTTEGRKEVERALDIALQNNLAGAAAEAYRLLGTIAEYASRYTDEQTAFANAISYCARHDQAATASLCMGCLSYSFFRSGNWKRSEQTARQVIADRKAPAPSRCVAEGVLGLLLAYRGEQRPAGRLLKKSYDAGRQMGIVSMDFFCLLGLAIVAENAGKIEEAATHLLKLLETWRSTDDRHDAIPGLSHAVSFFAEHAQPGGAAAAAEALDRIAISTVNPEASGAAMAARGELRWLEGKPGQAVRDFRKALDAFEQRDLSVERIRVRLRLGVALQQTGDDSEGRELLLDARQRARRLGARPLAAKIEIALKGHSTGAPEAGETWDLLSARQREVARLIAKGLTNKEIAGALGLSVRTIDMHVAHILERLDCRTRTHAAARITAALG